MRQRFPREFKRVPVSDRVEEEDGVVFVEVGDGRDLLAVKAEGEGRAGWGVQEGFAAAE